MGKYYEPLPEESFESIHLFVLGFIGLKKEIGDGDATERIASTLVNSGITLEMAVRYLLDRMTIERGGVPSDRGNIFAKVEKQFKRDLDANRSEGEKKLREEEEGANLDWEVLRATVDSSLLLTSYFPLMVRIEEDNPLPGKWVQE